MADSDTPDPSALPASVAEHERAAAGTVARVAILTVSDTRTLAEDTSGDTIARLLADARHEVVDRQIVTDDPASIDAQLHRWTSSEGLDAIITTGGTGISPRDNTVDVVRRHVAKELPGFGEIFRRLSYDEIGPPAMLSAAFAGVTAPPRPMALFALPGSRAAVRLALSALILPILPHLLRELRKGT